MVVSFRSVFYLMFALFIKLGIKSFKLALPIWFLAIVLTSLIDNTLSRFLFLHQYILQFIMGCFAGYLFIEKHVNLLGCRKYLLYGGIGCFIISSIISYASGFATKADLESRFIYGISATAIILGSALNDSVKPFKVGKFMSLLGDSSYVLYLVHPLILATLYKVAQGFSFIKSTELGYLLGLICLVVSVCAQPADQLHIDVIC